MSISQIKLCLHVQPYLNILDAAVGRDDGVLDVVVPEVELGQVAEQVLVHHLELAG